MNRQLLAVLVTAALALVVTGVALALVLARPHHDTVNIIDPSCYGGSRLRCATPTDAR